MAAGSTEVGDPIWQLPLCAGLPLADRFDGRRHQEHQGSARAGPSPRRGSWPSSWATPRGSISTSPGRRSRSRSTTLDPWARRAYPCGRWFGSSGSGRRRERPRVRVRVAIFAHPDDAEICAGGTLAAWCTPSPRRASAGADERRPRLARPRRSPRAELAAIRLTETKAAGDLLGLASVRVLSTHDGDLQNTPEVREAGGADGSARSTPRPCCPATPPLSSSRIATTTTPTIGWQAGSAARLRVPRQRQPALLQRAPRRGTRPAGRPRRLARLVERAEPHPGHLRAPSGRRSPALAETREPARGRASPSSRSSWARRRSAPAAKIGVEFAEEFRVLDLS